MTRLFKGNAFLQRLVELGVVPPHVRRVIIDAHYDDVLKIYVEHLDTEGLLKLEATDLKGARVIVAGKEEGE